jgi:hypothetical protein
LWESPIDSIRSDFALVDLGQDIYPRAQQTPAALRAQHQADVDRWWPVVKAASTKTN